jgi:hypothetical protein
MLLSLDNLAKRYGLLPSEALGRANTFDLYVLDVSTKFQAHLNDQSQGKTKEPSKEHIMRLYNQAKEYHDNN